MPFLAIDKFSRPPRTAARMVGLAKATPQKLFRQRLDRNTCSMRSPAAEWWELEKKKASRVSSSALPKFAPSSPGHRQQTEVSDQRFVNLHVMDSVSFIT